MAINITSIKGGTGKTNIVILLAQSLAATGKIKDDEFVKRQAKRLGIAPSLLYDAIIEFKKQSRRAPLLKEAHNG
jgi:Mrp family chromosome partitioning ATPase